jgi:fatty-acid desaturase
VPWLAFWHLLQGENWHGNHHAQPWSARLGLRPRQVDAGWWVIVALERLRLARGVNRPRPLAAPVAAQTARSLILDAE